MQRAIVHVDFFNVRGKSGLHRAGSPLIFEKDTADNKPPEGKCHREDTACALQKVRVRVKRWGKSPPGSRCKPCRSGKPLSQQDQIGNELRLVTLEFRVLVA